MNIYSFSRKDLEKYFEQINEKKFKAIQVYEWLYKKRVNNFEEMTNIKKDIIKKLKEDFTLEKPEIIKIKDGKDVHKYESLYTDKFIFYPYKRNGNTISIVELDELLNKYPLTYYYIMDNEPRLWK